MSKFITIVSANNKTFIVNVAHIIRVDQMSDSCIIRMTPCSNEMNLSVKVKMTLEEILSMINS